MLIIHVSENGVLLKRRVEAFYVEKDVKGRKKERETKKDGDSGVHNCLIYSATVKALQYYDDILDRKIDRKMDG